MVYKFFDKKTGSGVIGKAGVSVNEQLAEELHKPVIKKLKRKKSMRDLKTIFGQQIQLKWNHFLLRIIMLNTFLCIIGVFTKSWVKTSKDKKGKIVLNNFIEIVN